MPSLTRPSERWRVLPVLAAAGAVALLVFGVALGGYNEKLYRTQKIREVAAQARILAASVTAALAFDDEATAQEYLNALRANPDIEAAGLYNEAGALAASYAKGGVRPPGRTPPFQEPVFQGARVVVVLPVREGAAQLGAVWLETTSEPFGRLMARHAGLALLLVMASLLTAVLGLAQAVLRRANSQLARHADELAEANRQLKVQMEEREKAEEALRQSQKMEAIGQLTGGVAHDFNNILMVASSGLDLLDRTKDAARRQALKDGVRQAVDRGASLTRQLLAISRRSALQPEVIDVRDRIEGMRVLLDHSLREDISVQIELQSEVWPVEADPSQLEVALLNIAVNARDAMPDGGVITIRAENAPGMADGDLRGDFVCLSVTDEGMGMSRELLGRVFEPFFTTKGVGKGTGLGLSQVYGFSRASGGDVRVQSAPGEGATVSIYLPRSHKPLRQESGEAQVAAIDRSSIRHGRALLVEDEDGVASLVAEMLRELGYEVVRAPTAAIALQVLDREPDLDLVLSDMVMPGRLNGMDLAREIGRLRPALPVVLTTGYSEAATVAREHGFRLLMKPYRMDALAAALADIRASVAAR